MEDQEEEENYQKIEEGKKVKIKEWKGVLCGKDTKKMEKVGQYKNKQRKGRDVDESQVGRKEAEQKRKYNKIKGKGK